MEFDEIENKIINYLTVGELHDGHILYIYMFYHMILGFNIQQAYQQADLQWPSWTSNLPGPVAQCKFY